LKKYQLNWSRRSLKWCGEVEKKKVSGDASGQLSSYKWEISVRSIYGR